VISTTALTNVCRSIASLVVVVVVVVAQLLQLLLQCVGVCYTGWRDSDQYRVVL